RTGEVTAQAPIWPHESQIDVRCRHAPRYRRVYTNAVAGPENFPAKTGPDRTCRHRHPTPGDRGAPSATTRSPNPADASKPRWRASRLLVGSARIPGRSARGARSRLRRGADTGTWQPA